MKLAELMNTTKDAITVRRVFGEPHDKNGVTVIPAATIAGGGGGGGGHDENGQKGQEGGGFGMRGRPAGAYVIKDGAVTWNPAVDPNRIVAVVGAVLIVFLLSRARVERARIAAARRTRGR